MDQNIQRLKLANELLPILGHRRAWANAFAKYPKTIPEHVANEASKSGRPRAVAKARKHLASFRKQGRKDLAEILLQEYPELSVAIDLTDGASGDSGTD